MMTIGDMSNIKDVILSLEDIHINNGDQLIINETSNNKGRLLNSGRYRHKKERS